VLAGCFWAWRSERLVMFGALGVGVGGLGGSELECVEELEEDFQPRVVGEDPPSKLSGAGDDLAGDVYERGAEGSELHGEQLVGLRVAGSGLVVACWYWHEQRAPGFQVPCETGHGHVRPVGDQGVDRGVQSVQVSFQLTDQVFLVATIAGLTDDLVRGEIPVVGDVEKV